jgi:hypothetical protein
LLRSSVPVLGTALAGCSSLGLGRGKLTLTLLNFTSEPRRLYVQLLREDQHERENAFVLDREYKLDRDDTEVGHEEDADVVPSRPYLVRANVDDVHDHYHFHPACAGEDGPQEELYVEVREYSDEDPNDGLYIRFKQNVCGGDSGLL